MKYSEILHFNPIVEVIQFNLLSNPDYQLDTVRNFVYPEYFLDTILPEFVKNMTFGGHDQKGIQVIGSYGTGKSHLMGLVQLVAEHANYLPELQNERAREILEPIAGKYLVHRFELQHNNSLWRIITFELQRFLNANNIDYQFEDGSLKGYGEQLSEMMAAFDEKYPDKGFILAIDEMLHFLRLRAESGHLQEELPVLQALGQACNNSRFVFMFGVQELIYSDRKFQFAAEQLRQVKDRFRDLTIRREDVSFVVQKRLLDKTDSQKAKIRAHLLPFTKFFADMHGNLDKYVNLFPVHPSYIENFEKIRIARSQREILKVLSRHFDKIKDTEIPANEPGLITYDQYFEQMMADPTMTADPDFKTVSDTVKLVHDKIDNNFEGVRARQIPLAKRIANACGVKIIQAEIGKQNGATAETLTDDLCCVFPVMDNREFLIDQVDNCANQIIKATSGQYFDKKDNNEFALRTEGGINPDQMIKDYAENLSPALRDKAFSAFMVQLLSISENPYRTGFDIYPHELVWESHRISRDGYIFFGGPNEKSTTHPRQHFYMIFMPVFRTDVQRGHDTDEVYFVGDGLSEEFKELVCMHGAATALWSSAPSQQKAIFLEKRNNLFNKANAAFKACYLDGINVYFNGDEPRTMRSFSLPGQGTPLMDIFDCVASSVLEDAFHQAAPAYPAFTKLNGVVRNENRQRYISNAISKAVKPDVSNTYGEAILAGLGLWKQNQLSADESDFAQSLIGKLEEKGDGMVLNRDEIIVPVANSDNKIWRTLDFSIEADLEFVVMAAMVQLGLIEIKLADGTLVNASSAEKLRNVAREDYSQFSLIKKPQGINIPLVRKISKAFFGEDLSNRLDLDDTYSKIYTKSKDLAAAVATFQARTLPEAEQLKIAGVPVFDESVLRTLKVIDLPALKGFFDKMSTFSSKAKIRNLQFPLDQIDKFIKAQELVDQIKQKSRVIRRLTSLIDYLNNAHQSVAPGSDLMREIDSHLQEAINFDPINSSEQEVNNLETSLLETKQHYIDYYLARYQEVCLNDIEKGERTALLNSPEYQVCLVLQDCPVINPGIFGSWKVDFNKLRVASPTVASDIQQYPNPIAKFSPLTSLPGAKQIGELRIELKDIYEEWKRTIIAFLQEPHVQDTLGMLNDSDRQYARNIINGFEPIDTDQAARSVIEFVKHVSQDLEEVVITPAMLNNVLNRAMTVDEFTTAIDRFVLKLIHGKQREKVRIIFRPNTSDDE